MAKRGETRPWRVRYVWENGIKGMNAYTSKDQADSQAEVIRQNGRNNGSQVTVTVENRDA